MRTFHLWMPLQYQLSYQPRLVFQLSNLMKFAGSSWRFSLSKPRDLTMCHVVFWKNSPMSPLKTSVCRSLGAPTVAWHLSISRILIETSLIFKVPFSHLWEHHFQPQKGTFFALLIGTFLNRKKGTFFALLKRSLQTEKKYLFRALKFCLVKWEMDEKRTILTLKHFHPKA